MIGLGVYIFGVMIPIDILRWGSRQCNPTFNGGMLFPESVCAYALAASEGLYIIFLCLLGTLIIWQKKHDKMTIFTAFGLVFSGLAVTPGSTYLPVFQETAPFALPVTALGFIWLSLIFLIAPDGQFVPRWSRLIAVALILWFGSWVVIPGAFPIQVAALDTPSLVTRGLLIIYLSIAPSFLVQLYRYRNAYNATQRQQAKVLVFAVSFAFASYLAVIILEVSVRTAFAGTPLVGQMTQLGIILRLICISFGTVGIAVSALRYRLWEADLVITRSLVVGMVTAVLGGVFFGVTILIQRIALSITGGQRSEVAVVVAAFSIALAFTPTLNRLKTVIDRRFYPKYLAKAEALKTATQQQRNNQSGQGVTISAAPMGKVVGSYEVFEPIGRGGMADVYRGRHITLSRPAAIKIMAAQAGSAAEERGDALTRFEREAKVIAGLRHPNIVQVYDFGVADGMYYIAMELINGQDLAQVIRERGALPFAEALSLIKQLADALDYAHSVGVVHRDVKPQNVLMQPTTAVNMFTLAPLRPILTDFGIAKLTESDSGLTKTGVLGTLDYIAPEQILAATHADGRADQYALGIMAFQMLTGRLPFIAHNPGALVLAHLQQKPSDPRQLRADLPPTVTKALERVLAKEPSERYPTAAEFAAALA